MKTVLVEYRTTDNTLPFHREGSFLSWASVHEKAQEFANERGWGVFYRILVSTSRWIEREVAGKKVKTYTTTETITEGSAFPCT